MNITVGDLKNPKVMEAFITRVGKLKPIFARVIEEDYENNNYYEMCYIILTNIKFMNDNKVFNYTKKELQEILKALPKKDTQVFNKLVTRLSDEIEAGLAKSAGKKHVSIEKIVDWIGEQLTKDGILHVTNDVLAGYVADAVEKLLGQKIEKIPEDRYFEIFNQANAIYGTDEDSYDGDVDLDEIEYDDEADTNLDLADEDDKQVLTEDEINSIEDLVGEKSANYSTIYPDTLQSMIADAVFEVTGTNVTDIDIESYNEIYSTCEGLYLTEMNVQESFLDDI